MLCLCVYVCVCVCLSVFLSDRETERGLQHIVTARGNTHTYTRNSRFSCSRACSINLFSQHVATLFFPPPANASLASSFCVSYLFSLCKLSVYH